MGEAQSKVKLKDGAVYAGQLANRLPHGKGTIILKGRQFEGVFQDGLPRRGKIRTNTYVYEGKCRQTELNGEGSLVDRLKWNYQGIFQKSQLMEGQIFKTNQKGHKAVIFKGTFNKNHRLSGQGAFFEQDESSESNWLGQKKGRKIEGSFVEGQLCGQGSYEHVEGDLFQGKFKAGHRDGVGTYRSEGMELKGRFKNDELDGQAVVVFSNGDKYTGTFKEGQYSGKGKYEHGDGTVFEGTIVEGKPSVSGKITYPVTSSLLSYEGELSNGLFNGVGELVYRNGVTYKGPFLSGHKMGRGQLTFSGKKYTCYFNEDQVQGELKEL